MSNPPGIPALTGRGCGRIATPTDDATVGKRTVDKMFYYRNRIDIILCIVLKPKPTKNGIVTSSPLEVLWYAESPNAAGRGDKQDLPNAGCKLAAADSN
jgi:hypothetical protein